MFALTCYALMFTPIHVNCRSVFYLPKPRPLNYLVQDLYGGPTLVLQGAKVAPALCFPSSSCASLIRNVAALALSNLFSESRSQRLHVYAGPA